MLFYVQPKPVGVVLSKGKVLDGSNSRSSISFSFRRHNDPPEFHVLVRIRQSGEQHKTDALPIAEPLNDQVSEVRITQCPGMLGTRPRNDIGSAVWVAFGFQNEIEIVRSSGPKAYGF